MDQYSRPQGSFNTPNSGYTYHLIYNPIRTYRDVVTQTYNTQSAEDHNKYTGRTAANTNSHQHERHHNSKGNDEHLEPGDRYGNRHGYDFDNDRMDLEFTNTQSNQTGYEENRHGHNANTSLSSAGTGAGTDSQGSKSNIGEEASINMLTLPTINERICIRWAAQKGWEPYMEGMNKISEPTNSWLLTSMKDYYIDLRIRHPWNWQHNQQEQEMQLKRIQILDDYHKALASGYGRPMNGKGCIRDDGTIFVNNGGPMNRESPLCIGGQPLDLPKNSVITVPCNSNPILIGTSIESLSAGHYVRSKKKNVHSMASIGPFSFPSHNIHITWSEWINGEPGGIDVAKSAGQQTMAYPLQLPWRATLGTYTTRIEYEGSTTFRMIGQRMNSVMHAEGAYQEGWKVVPVASMPLSSKVSLSTSSGSFVDRYRRVRDREMKYNRKDSTNSRRDTDRNMPRHRCDENCRRANNDTEEIRPMSDSQGHSRPSSKISADAASHRNFKRARHVRKTKTILTQARTCIVLCYDDPSYQARGMIIRVGDHCQGILRVGDYITAERWQWYPGAAKSAASLNTVARAEAAARNTKSRDGLSNNSTSRYESRVGQEACNSQRSDRNDIIVISDDSDEAAHVPVSISTNGSTPTLIGSEVPVPTSSPLGAPAPSLASIAAVTDSGAGWKRELRIGRGYLPCSIAFGVSAPRIREGTSVNFMGMIWEVVEVFNW